MIIVIRPLNNSRWVDCYCQLRSAEMRYLFLCNTGEVRSMLPLTHWSS